MKKVLSFVFVIALLTSLFAIPASASSTSWVSVYINNQEFTGGIDVKDNTTFVGIRKFSTSMDKNANVTYNSSTKTLTVQTDNLYLTATAGTNYIVANGRYLYTESPIYLKNGVMYAPVLLMARAFDAKISWRDSNSSFYVTRGSGGILSGSKYYDSDEVYWLAKIISAESQGEPLLGKIAVGNVILNRVNSSEFPNTIYGVIFDRKYGTQFSPVANGTIYNDATWESTVAAKICLEGYSVSNKILYFVNPKFSPNSWISRNRVFFRQIGNHAFYI
ncbi:MAG: cell wall hydrolase [Eubacteriales bacterium]